MKSTPNPSPNVEKLNDVIKYFDGNREKIKKFYTEELQKPFFTYWEKIIFLAILIMKQEPKQPIKSLKAINQKFGYENVIN